MNQRIEMAGIHFSADDRTRIHAEVDRILDGALSMGPNVRAFEEEFAAMSGCRHAIAVNSCTAALEIALAALDAAGGEVIIPPQTFIATAMAVHNAGATPVFAEIAATTMCLDLADVERRIGSRTRGVIVVHMAGLVSPEIFKLRELCDRRGLFLIEDAAHAPGAVRGGRAAGTIGHVGCFSFFPTKVMTSGEGGMITTDDDAVAARARSLQHRGRDMQAPVESYVLPGRNVRMTEMAALLGRVQLSHLPDFLERRRGVVDVYRTRLSANPLITLVVADERSASSCWKCPVVLDPRVDRLRVKDAMAGAGIAVDFAYNPPVHLQPVCRDLFGTAPGDLPLSEDLLGRHLCLPCHPGMSDDDAVRVATALDAAVHAACAGR